MAMKHVLEFYSRPAELSSAGKRDALFKNLPDDLEKLMSIVQGLAIHEYTAFDFYGLKTPDDRKQESHIRSLEKMLDRLMEIDPAPLQVQRPPEKRLNGVCHHFMMLFLGILRFKGVPVRARCGFGSYFNPGYFEDHWVCEYWNSDKKQWQLADPQFDEIWKSKAQIDHDVLDVPRDRFLTAADAWIKCQNGEEDPMKFGIFVGGLRGLWFIAGNLIHDAAALNNMEMLPWDVWGAMPRPDEKLNKDQLAFFDHIAKLTRTPDSSFAELRSIYENDERVRVPQTVFNAILNRPESVW